MSRQLIALLLLTISAPALAQTAPASKTPATAKPDKKICRYYDTTGSIMNGTKVCHTKAEWASIDGTNTRAASDVSDPRGRYGGGATRLGGSN